LELKHRIVELSSHDSLAALARTHTAYQREAEQALYHTLSCPSFKCLKTLATNSEKAGFVRSLTMEYIRNENDDHVRPAIDCLLDALVNMHSLSDFRLRIRRYEVQPWMVGDGSLDKILCNVHFRLQTLYCDEPHDLSRIIKSQTELEILGIYRIYDKAKFLGALKRLQNAQLHLPVVVALESTFHRDFDKISIFPAFYSIDRHPAIHQVLAKSFDKDSGSDTLADADRIFQLSIYLVDSCDMPSIHELTKNMTVMFPKIVFLTFCFEDSCEISSQEMKKILSLFPSLRYLIFELWYPRRRNGKIPEDIKMAHVKDWEFACPELISVSFIDGSTHHRGSREWIDIDL